MRENPARNGPKPSFDISYEGVTAYQYEAKIKLDVRNTTMKATKYSNKLSIENM
jgi:hypothetical protein